MRERRARAAWEAKPRDKKDVWKPPVEAEWERIWKWSRKSEEEMMHEALSLAWEFGSLPRGSLEGAGRQFATLAVTEFREFAVRKMEEKFVTTVAEAVVGGFWVRTAGSTVC